MKTAFFKGLQSQLEDPVYLTEKTDELKQEIASNHWILTLPPGLIGQVSTNDFLVFIQQVKDRYQAQLDQSRLDIDLIFYLWFEAPGRLCFNFINSNHDHLPFECKCNWVNAPETIIDQFLSANNAGQTIPWAELETLQTPESTAEAERRSLELRKKYVLDVYQETIQKHS